MAGPPQFEDVLSAFQDRVFRLCCAILGDRTLADETSQEIFVRIWKALPAYRNESSLSTWIYAISRNACFTALKERSRRGVSLEIPAIRQAAERAAAGPQRPDRSPDMLKMLGALPENYRQVIVLFYMQEKSYEEVALMLDLPLGTVKTYLHRARKQLAAAVMEVNQPTMAEGSS